MYISYYAGHLSMQNLGYLFDFTSTHAISTPVIFNFWSVFHSQVLPTVPHCHETWTKRCDFLCASFDVYGKFVGRCPPTQTPTRKLNSGFLRFNSKEIGSSLVSLQTIFEALQSELFRYKSHSLGSKILKFPEFNLNI